MRHFACVLCVATPLSAAEILIVKVSIHADDGGHNGEEEEDASTNTHTHAPLFKLSLQPRCYCCCCCLSCIWPMCCCFGCCCCAIFFNFLLSSSSSLHCASVEKKTRCCWLTNNTRREGGIFKRPLRPCVRYEWLPACSRKAVNAAATFWNVSSSSDPLMRVHCVTCGLLSCLTKLWTFFRLVLLHVCRNGYYGKVNSISIPDLFYGDFYGRDRWDLSSVSNLNGKTN